MKILTKQAAEASPVGDAQEEPNEDPFLERPTEGRGLADFFKGMGFSMGMCWIYMQVFGGLAVVVVSTLILFVKPGILIK